ncbi:C39 family peptidase [Adlercreutzia murintestinalis]|uniref:C39 family peptidase n=1 Tax=Adlercreutzia murintestinalis TaxID=2941325 RepID=UPI00203BABC1|nr:C39 family peptidase [Adlercreutzia murintestinalis]
MNIAYTYTSEDAFPEPRDFTMDRRSRQMDSLSRQVYLSKLAQRRRPSRAKQAFIIAVTALVGVLVMAALNVFVFSSISALPADLMAQPSAEDGSKSTPRHLWVRGITPFLYQVDAEWADEPYADGTIGTHGCGPTCLSMVYVQLTGKRDMDPVAMAAFSEESGYTESGITSWLLMSEGAARLGLMPQELSASADTMRAQLRMGRPIICSMGPGDFTTEGHFIVVCGVDDQGRLIVHDPNSPERSQQVWDASRVLSQCLNLWSFSSGR